MIVIQRVRVRWTAAARGAPAATARHGLDRPVALPQPLPAADVVIHEVLSDEAVGYERHAEVLTGGTARARNIGLWLGRDGATLTVDRLPGSAAYPRPYASTRLFALAPGQVGRYRANFRFTGCACNPSWYYEDWLVHVSHGQANHDGFLHGEPDRDVDHRVHLYGGTGRRGPRGVDTPAHRRVVPSAARGLAR
ncbi:hypothetical protein O7626_16845 [Micromonospora sp. WMMD1102]|uniref:hypothetical protein n=1 Tax=Micromonospora sp. WMMD1102 TaxID=3016105 RepID=UPI002414F329|nr:hypothetical protein [Micromonospora sp. WMMD1102]MDG4787583.1 hypothetical protein [Micromonospora sp. WMMD1102]